jgi:hypothetical protein
MSPVSLEEILVSVWRQTLVDGERYVEIDGGTFHLFRPQGFKPSACSVRLSPTDATPFPKPVDS